MQLFKLDGSGILRVVIEHSAREVRVLAGTFGGDLSEQSRKLYDDEGASEEAAAALVADYEGRDYVRERTPEPHAARFFREGFADLLVERYKVKRREPSSALVEQTESVYGRPMPSELRALLGVRGSSELGWCNFGEWRIWADDLIPFDFDGGNLFEQLTTKIHPFHQRLILTDLVPLGTAGNGDGYHAFLDLKQPETPHVYFLDHETEELSPFCDSISTLAELNRLYEVNAGDLPMAGDPIDEVKRGMKRLESRVAPSWHYKSLVKNSETNPTFEADATVADFLWFRSQWIFCLLQGEVRDAGSSFEPLVKWHRANMIWSDAKARFSTLIPSRGLYWLYTLYFFERVELGEAVALLKTSPSRLMRDAATVFGELAAGRTHVGKIDFAATRARFASLGLDPEKAEERMRAAEAEKQARVARRQAHREEATAWLEGKSAREIAEEAWRRLDTRASVEVFAAALAKQSPELGIAFRRARAVVERSEGWPFALEALRHAAAPEERAMLAFALVCGGLYPVEAIVGALSSDERALVLRHGTEFLARLRTWRRAEHGKQHAIAALSLLGLLDGAELEALVTRHRWVEGDDDDDDDDPDDDEGGSEVIAASTFGEVVRGDAALRAEATDEDEDEDQDESDDDEDQDQDEDQDESDDDEDESDEGEDESDEGEDESDEGEDSTEAAASDDAAEREVALEDETPLVETPGYLRSITDKAPLRATIEALAKTPTPTALAMLTAIVTEGPAEVSIPALIAIAHLPTDDARVFLEAKLDGPRRRTALYALARRADAAALPAVERALARVSGLADVTVYDQLMREAVRGAAGKPIDSAVIRFALQTVMDNKFAAVELHEVALGLVGKHASADEVRATALAFLDAEQPRVRAAAFALLRSVQPDATVRVLDNEAIAQIFAERGTDGLRAALRDESAIFRDRILHFAKERGVLAELETEAIALVTHMARFPLYTNGYERDGHERTARAIRALFTLNTPSVTATLYRLITSSNPSTRKAFEYEDAVKERLGKLGSLDPRSQLDAVAGKNLAAGVEATELIAPEFILGAPVHAIAFVQDAVIVAGGGKVTAFDRRGRVHRDAGGFVAGWGYDIAVHEGVGVVVIGYSHGHCLVHDLAGFKRRTELAHGGAGVRKVVISPSGKWLATACDDKTLHVWDLVTSKEVRVHHEPYDVNTVAWIDEDTIAFGTDQHAGVIPREGGKPRRVSTGGGAEVQVIDGMLLVGTAQHGLAFVDPKTLEIREKLPVKGVARARVSRDRKTVFVACWEGKHTGFSRWDRATKTCERIHEESLFGMEIDSVDGRIFIGGASNRVTVLSSDGRAAQAPEAPRDDQGWFVLPAGNDAIQAIARAELGDEVDLLEAGGRVVRYSIGRKQAMIVAKPPRPLPRAAEAFAHVGGGVVTSAFDAVARYGGSGEPWARATNRSEKIFALGEVIVTSSGKHLGWLDPETGELLAERDAGVESSWVEYLFPIDDDRFFVAGYDERRLQIWSASEKCRVGEMKVNHQTYDGRFARPRGIGLDRPSRRLLVSYWDDTIDVLALRGDAFELEQCLVLHSSYDHLAFTDDGSSLVVASEHGVLALAYPSGVPLWRWKATHTLTSMTLLEGGRVLVGANDGAIVLLEGTARNSASELLEGRAPASRGEQT